MKNNTTVFEKLLNETTNHLKDKKYVYRPRVPKTTGQGRNKEVVRDNDGNIVYKPNTFYDPTPSKNVMLSIALSMAYENYGNIRPHSTAKILEATDVSEMLVRYFSKKFYDKLNNSLIDSKQNQEYQAIENFRQLEYKIFGTLERLRNYHSHYVHEPSILSFEDYFDSNSRLKTTDLEEAKFWFEKHFNDAKNHLQNSLNTRKEKLIKEKENSKTSEKEKNRLKVKLKEIDKAINKFKYELIFFNDKGSISLNGQLFMATMFLYKRQAKIVLDKWRSFRLDKDLTGYGNSIHTFFTYYCMSEKYSLNNYNNSLLKFRNITSKLTTIPSSTHEKLSVIYDKIRDINETSYKEVERLEKQQDRKPKKDVVISNELKTLILQKETLIGLLENKNKSSWRKQLEALEIEINSYSSNNLSKLDIAKSKIMPIRNRNILTEVLLQYMLDFKLFGTNTEIAIAKTMTDRLDYFENHTEISKKESLTHLKNRKKISAGLSTEERTILNEHYKELKRNFVFKTVSELELQNGFEKNEEEQTILKEPQGFQFAIKKKNALIRYTLKEGKTNKVVNITLSPQLLLKLVFIHIEQKDDKVFEKYIEKFIKTRIRYFNIPKITAQQLVEKFKKENNNLNINKIIPKSILNQVAGYRKNAFDIDKLVKERFKTRIEYLEKFRTNNLNQPKPWQYESKQKIDIILNYMHYKLMYAVFANDGEFKEEKDVKSFIRHTYFNTDSYDVARQYFRFFGRYTKGSIKDAKGYGKESFIMPNQITKLVKEDNPIIFNFIKNEIGYATSLEELYSAVISNYIDALEKLHNDYLNNVKHNYAEILKVKPPKDAEHINSLINTHFLKSFAIGDEIISVKTILSEKWEDFKAKKEKALNGKPLRFSEYSFIREHLQSEGEVTTNIDYIFKHILPQITVFKNKKIPYQVSRELLKLKTEELILWNIAKVYWLKANRAPYNLKSLAQNRDSSSYQVYTSFNKVYKQELDYTIKINTNFWNATKPNNRDRFKAILDKNPELPNKEIYIKLKVPAKRYDNKFLKVETQLIIEYALYTHFTTGFNKSTNEIVLPKEYNYIMDNGKRLYNLQNFDDLIKVIYRDLKKSLTNIGDLLKAEKQIIDTTDFDTINELTKKYKEEKEKITDFFISFNNAELLNKFKANNFIIDDIRQFRNNALHYQLQNPNKIEEIEDLLKRINTKDGISENEFYFEE